MITRFAQMVPIFALTLGLAQMAQAGSPCALFSFWDAPLFSPLEIAYLKTNDPRAFLDAAAFLGLRRQSGARALAAFKAEKASEELGRFSKCRVAKEVSSPGGIITRFTIFYIPGRHDDVLLIQRAIPVGVKDEELESVSLTVGYGSKAVALLAELD